MPVLPVAPGTLTTVKETLRSSSIILPDLRATWSAPPPGPHGTINSIGRDGYFSCAAATHAANASRNATKWLVLRCSRSVSLIVNLLDCDRFKNTDALPSSHQRPSPAFNAGPTS